MNAPVNPFEVSARNAHPPLKWVGSKRQLEEPILKAINRIHPGEISTYYEPFFGGGAIFFALVRAGRIRHAVLSDSNPDLINFYNALKFHPERLILALKALKKKGFTEKRYYEVRANTLGSEVTRAARFLYINKCGYNGLWRVNKKGLCNVPWGRRKVPPEICNEDGLWSAHHALQRAHIVCRDFKESVTVIWAQPGFVYFDPPYWPTRPTANFTSYTAEDFGKKSQEGLCWHFRELTIHGLPALLSNSDVPETRKLYAEFKKQKLQARRNVNSDGQKRGAVSELLVESTFRK